MSERPTALVFDVLDTLFPLGPLEWRFREAGVPRVLMTRWYDHLLRDAFALSLLGSDGGFEDVARGSLRDITGHQIAPSAEDAVIDGLTLLEPRREAAEALATAREAGVRTAASGLLGAAGTRRLLERAGLEVDTVVDDGDPRAWKPLARAYQRCARALEVPVERLGLVTAHGWDVAGGRAAGLVTGWSSHLEGRFPVVFDGPDVEGYDLTTTVRGLLALGSEPAEPEPEGAER
ncbi:HAD family hydrolase [Nocardiopsis sp. MG754419]|uniref:HAD family hydrolase n=1 Tax=Nocardiopsis sp. MG754419 TaxID=2259865 RepID=UPI001BA5A1AE|nr:HAD family hydrolase [Nocardiopsis sp. MG754419]MBR8743550.1 haloacid dehalogenase [Nocardiopsis sp. MG754419]